MDRPKLAIAAAKSPRELLDLRMLSHIPYSLKLGPLLDHPLPTLLALHAEG
jgi:hypothetical protein